MVGSGGFFTSDLYSAYHVVQNTMISFPKLLIISALKEYFAKDTKYHYVEDDWGFPYTPDHTNLDLKAGINNDSTTRIYIGEEDRFDVAYYPSVIVRHSGARYVPISINQEQDCVQYGYRLFIDGYGNKYSLRIPVNFIYAGSWDINLDIDVMAEGAEDRSTIVQAIAMHLQSNIRNELTYDGLFIKGTSVSGETKELYQNDNIYKQTISLECRGEYRRLIPVGNVIEVITACIEIGNYTNDVWHPDPNLTIQFKSDLTNTILSTQSL
jgi:hypothetical protein